MAHAKVMETEVNRIWLQGNNRVIKICQTVTNGPSASLGRRVELLLTVEEATAVAKQLLKFAEDTKAKTEICGDDHP